MGIDPLTGQHKTARYTDDTGVRERVQRQVEERERAFGGKCECPDCDCQVKHRFGKVCAACRAGDHWNGLAAMLDKISERQEARLTDPPDPEEDQ